MEAVSAKLAQSNFYYLISAIDLCLLTISWIVAHTNKYYCFNLNYLPCSVESFGYNTFVIYSALCFAYSALQYSPLLNEPKSNSFNGIDFQSLSPIVL